MNQTYDQKSSPAADKTTQPPLPTKNTGAWLVCMSSALFFFFAFIQMNMFNAIGPKLLISLNITAAQLGNLSANYFYAYVLMLFPAGIILDRYSVRYTLIITMFICVLSTLLFSFVHGYAQASMCRFLTGLSASFTFLASIRLATRWFEPKKLAFVIGCVVTVAMLGGTLAQTPLTLLTDNFGWRYMLVIDAVFGLFLLGIIIAFVRDHPENTTEKNLHGEKTPLLAAIVRVMRNKQNWFAGLYTSTMNLPIMLLGAMWGSMYLTQANHLTRNQASMVNSFLFIGAIIGSPLIGRWSDKIRRRIMPMRVGAVFSLALVLLLIFDPGLSFVSLIVLFLLLGFITSTQVLSYPLIAESNHDSVIGAAEGLSAVLIMSGGFLQPLFGFILQSNWNHHMINHIPVYSLLDYHHAMFIFPCAFLISLVLTFLLKETGAKSHVE